MPLPHALTRLPAWRDAWANTGRFVLLLDFDGTLSPIVPHPDEAGIPDETKRALERLRTTNGVEMAVVSGRGMADARERVGLRDIAYAGNHGMEIEGPGMHRIHQDAAEARPSLEAVARRLEEEVGSIEGVLVEDKELTLSIHYRRAPRATVDAIRASVLDAAGEHEELRVTEGKELLEVRPAVDWDKGRAVEFLLGQFAIPPGTPVIYLGDDRTDEDAFRALLWHPGIAGEGVIVADPPPPHTAATSYLRSPTEVAALLTAIADAAPGGTSGKG